MITGLEHSHALDEVLYRLADRGLPRTLRSSVSCRGSYARVATRAVVGMIMAMALFHDFGMSGSATPPTRGEIIDEMTQLVMHGALHRPAQSASPTGQCGDVVSPRIERSPPEGAPSAVGRARSGERGTRSCLARYATFPS